MLHGSDRRRILRTSLELIERYELSRLVHQRGGEREFRFARQVRNAVLPVRHEGQTVIVPWGCRAGTLPRSGYTWLTTVEAGEWTVFRSLLLVIAGSKYRELARPVR